MATIHVTKQGEISQPVLEEIQAIMGECYEVVGEPMSDSIDLHMVEKSSGETFFATHDALHGKPKVTVYLDKLLEMPQLIRLAGIRRQAAHSVLHGSLEYYLIKVPEDLIRAMKQYNLPEDCISAFLYSAGMAAKEYEVSRLLYGKNYVEDQAAYAKYILVPSAEEVLAWKLASRDKLEKIFHLASVIRDISCAVPLIQDEQIGGEIKNYIKKKIAHITPDYQSKVQRIIYDGFSSLGLNTFENIDLITKLLVEEIIDYELGERDVT
jgi:hypothetical protein